MATQIGHLVRGLSPEGDIREADPIMEALRRYAEIITPWARSVAAYMISDVDRRDERQWEANGLEMSQALRAELAYAPTGSLHKALQEEQVALIRSLPLEAANRVHKLATEAMMTSQRAEVISKQLLASGEVSASRARTIARTEVSRTAANFMQARAMFAGSVGYIWRTSGDADVRDTHKHMEGKYVRWDKPPKTDKGLEPYHAGCGPNCRCYAEPILPDL